MHYVGGLYRKRLGRGMVMYWVYMYIDMYIIIKALYYKCCRFNPSV